MKYQQKIQITSTNINNVEKLQKKNKKKRVFLSALISDFFFNIVFHF